MNAPSDDLKFFAQLSQELMREPAEAPTFEQVVRRAVDVIGPCQYAGITLRRRRNHLETAAASDPLVDECDGLQYGLKEGPCVDASLHEKFALSPDLTHEQRWTRWAPLVVELGMHSILSVQLSAEAEPIGALNLYSTQANAWTPEDLDVAIVFAAHAANAMSSARLATGLMTAMNRRHAIGVAQGMIMLRYDVNLNQSFEILRRLSSVHNVKVHDLAGEVMEHGQLPAKYTNDDGPADG